MDRHVLNSSSTGFHWVRSSTRDMVEFTEFMSVGLNRCGTDKETFADLVDLWNREKTEIKQMSKQDLEQNLRCP